MKIIKKNDEIVSEDEFGEIEKYNFEKEINFEKFITYLLNLNLSVKVNIEDTIEEKTEAEDNLVKLIINIKDNYNEKVDELKTFKEENEKKDIVEDA